MENKLTLAQQIDRPELVAKFAKTFNSETKAQRFLRSVVSAVSMTPALKKADPMSILSASMVAASLDLEINPNLGYAAIVPYGDKAQFQIMVNGLVQLAMRSGQIKKLHTFVVYQDEYAGFDKISGELKPLKEHDPINTAIAGYGAYMELVNGYVHTEYWDIGRVKAHAMKYSKSYKSGPWSTNFDAMASKTVLKYMLTHYAPKTSEMTTAFEADQAIIRGNADEGFSFDYADNPNNVEVQFSEDELAERNRIMDELEHTFNITSQDLVIGAGRAQRIEDVSTQYMRDTLETCRSKN